MDERLRNFYLQARVSSASPGQMLIMLYEALVENAENAELELGAAAGTPERVRAPQTISRCIDIITELSCSLRHEFDPDLCATLSNLYAFFARQLAQALSRSEAEPIRGILPLLRELRDAWKKAEKIAGDAQLAAGITVAA